MNIRASGTDAASPASTPLQLQHPVNALIKNRDLKKVTVIGAGSMGSGIAALLASAGIPVRLLDVASDKATERNGIARGGVARQLKAEGFTHPALEAFIETGNLEDDLHRIGDSDWIIEAIVEDLNVKRSLFSRIDQFRSDDAIVSSNTSTIPLKDLVEGRSDGFKQNFVISHFFNPPRRMLLLEVVTGEYTASGSRARVSRWAGELLGKSVVACRDTPGFIANRIGNYWMSVAALEAMKAGLTVEEADAIVGKPFGVPQTGVFGLFDYVGINLVPLVWKSLLSMLPPDDAHHTHDITRNELFASMLDRGLTGRFGPGGFYRRGVVNGTKISEVLDLKSGEYRAYQAPPATNHAGLRALCESPGRSGAYAWAVLSHLVQYSAKIAGEIAEETTSIDLAMRIGYNWARGPFELADEVGADWISARLEREGRDVPDLLREAARAGGFGAIGAPTAAASGAERPLRLADAKLRTKPIYENASASIWDIGDGVACLEIHTKLNACDENVVEAVQESFRLVPRGHRALVIGSDGGRAFSAGAKLDVFIAHVKAKEWGKLRNFVVTGQQAWLGLKYAPFPSVAAAAGLALGGGCELMMHCDAIVAHSELQAGYPERNAGIVPGWGGCTQLLLRYLERGENPESAAIEAFSTILSCDVTRSALFAKAAGFIRQDDHIVMSREHLLGAAKNVAIDLSDAYVAPQRAALVASGSSGRASVQERIDLGLAEKTLTQTDAGIAEELAAVLSGGAAQAGDHLSEADMMALEVDAMIELAKRSTTLARLEHLRSTNKPLRN